MIKKDYVERMIQQLAEAFARLLKLREAGSHGYLVSAPIPRDVLDAAAKAGEIVIRLEVDDALPGGLAIYGERFGRYPVDPQIIFHLGSHQTSSR